MIDISKGRYWDLPWSLVSGCTPCSPGCERCWALGIERRFRKPAFVPGDPIGSFPVVTHPERLTIPLKRRKPTVYALWNDLFHEAVPDELRDRVYSVMFCKPEHTFLVLTKRPDEMFRYANSRPRDSMKPERAVIKNELGWDDCPYSVPWPLPNVWHGLTVCNQKEVGAKMYDFIRVPGKKFLSLEPLLGSVIISPFLSICKCGYIESEHGDPSVPCKKFVPAIDAVILGGETGPGARPMDVQWVRSIRDQCAAVGVPFFLKSGLGKKKNYFSPEMKEWGNLDLVYSYLEDGEGWPPSIQMHRLLDGRTHDELPWVKP